jgi:hypothetical protein
MDDYIPQIRHQLAEVGSAYGTTRILKSWEKLIEDLIKEDDFGDRLDPSSDIRELTQSVVAGIEGQREKMVAIYDYVRSTMMWNGRESKWGRDPDDLVKAKQGTSGDINFLLMAMLRAAGIEVDPLLASTRSNGMITDMYPLWDQFNVVVARATVQGSTYVLDATDPLRPFDLVAPDLLNVYALVVKEGPVTWLPITTQKRFFHRSNARVTLGLQGEIHGAFSSHDAEYSALLKRKNLREKKTIDIAKEVFGTERIGMNLDSVTVSGRDSSLNQLVIEATGSGEAYAQVSGDNMYFNPVILDRLTSNPFTLKDRKFPIDMSYGRDIVCVTTFSMPPGFVPKEVPKDVVLGGGDLEYSRSTVARRDSVQTTTRMTITTSAFPADVYKTIRDLYDKIVAAESEQVILRRSPEVSQQPEPVKPTSGPAKGVKRK